ncbi:hypothetical protein [Aliigemmobacter aestuarii]|nr:hypothetical protein [Gemmobacter aestuarii]
MKKDRRWLKSAIATAQDTQLALPWSRATRSRPAAFKPAQPSQRKAAR